MPFDRNKHHRRTIRLPDYDYSRPGLYFVTICVKDSLCVFGDTHEEQVQLFPAGEIAQHCWQDIPNHYPKVVLDAFVIMPNHMHGIIGIIADEHPIHADDHPIRRGLINQTPTTPIHQSTLMRNEDPDRWILMKNPRPVLGKIVRAYKARTTHRIRQETGVFMWQRNYYEHVIRNDRDLDRIRRYITENPARWHLDTLNPTVLKTTAVPSWP